MQQVFLKTAAQNPGGTYGVLTMNNLPLCVTVERPWLDNQPDISCVPRGITMHFTKYQSPKNGWTWISQDAPGRSNIELHAANVPSQVEGCAGMGQYFTTFDGVMGVANSQVTMGMLRQTLPDEFDLVIS